MSSVLKKADKLNLSLSLMKIGVQNLILPVWMINIDLFYGNSTSL